MSEPKDLDYEKYREALRSSGLMDPVLTEPPPGYLTLEDWMEITRLGTTQTRVFLNKKIHEGLCESKMFTSGGVRRRCWKIAGVSDVK